MTFIHFPILSGFAEQVAIYNLNIPITHITSPDSCNTTLFKFLLINKEFQFLMQVFQIPKTLQ